MGKVRVYFSYPTNSIDRWELVRCDGSWRGVTIDPNWLASATRQVSKRD